MFVAEVPQVDGQLAQLVVPQVAVSQQDTKQGEGQSALTPCTLLQRRICQCSAAQDWITEKRLVLPHLVPTECLQVVQDLSDQGLAQLVDL